LGSSSSFACIAQRGVELLRASFANLGGAIFAGLQCAGFFIDPSAWLQLIEEEDSRLRERREATFGRWLGSNLGGLPG